MPRRAISVKADVFAVYIQGRSRRILEIGTGIVSLENKLGDEFIQVHSSNLIVDSLIKRTKHYNLQENCKISWRENDDFFLTLRFVRKNACKQFFSKVMSSLSKGGRYVNKQKYRYEEEQLLRLPNFEIYNIEYILTIIEIYMKAPLGNVATVNLIKRYNLIDNLVKMFPVCEIYELSHLNECLYKIVCYSLAFNDDYILNELFKESNIFNVMGILEYQPFRRTERKFRTEFQNIGKLYLPVKLHDKKLLALFLQTYRVDFIYDILTLHSQSRTDLTDPIHEFLERNKLQILVNIQSNNCFLKDLFAFITNPATEKSRRKYAASILMDLFDYSVLLDRCQKEKFNKLLMKLGLLPVLSILLMSQDKVTIFGSLSLLTDICSDSSRVFRGSILNEMDYYNPKCIMGLLIVQLLEDSSLDFKISKEILKVFENIFTMTFKTETDEKFIRLFFENFLPKLFIQFGDFCFSEYRETVNPHQIQIFRNIMKLLNYLINTLSSYIPKFFKTRIDAFEGIFFSLKFDDQDLILATLEIIASILHLDWTLFRTIAEGDFFEPLVALIRECKTHASILHPPIIKIISVIMERNIKTLGKYLVYYYQEELQSMNYDIVKALIQQYQN